MGTGERQWTVLAAPPVCLRSLRAAPGKIAPPLSPASRCSAGAGEIRNRVHFFSAAVQLRMTVAGDELSADIGTQIRKFCPSGVTLN
jgi:hypothetical protein